MSPAEANPADTQRAAVADVFDEVLTLRARPGTDVRYVNAAWVVVAIKGIHYLSIG